MPIEGKKIKSVAIIGAGAAGLTSLFELSNTNEDGTTGLAYTSAGVFDEIETKNRRRKPAFDRIVAFELKESLGGIWSPNFDNPDVIDEKDLNTEQYDDPFVLRPPTSVPTELANGLYTFPKPLKMKKSDFLEAKTWSASGIYRHLYSNVPKRYLRNSFIPYVPFADGDNDNILPLVTNSSVTDSLLNFARRHELDKFVRLRSEVVKVSKNNQNTAWRLIIKEVSEDGQFFNWYEEEFDAVLVSNGHYSVPYIPKIKGLPAWVSNDKNSVLHSKSFRNPDIFNDKKCLFVGTGLSGIDILQYAFPVAKEVIVSRTPNKEEIYPWLSKAATSDGILVRPRIKELLPLENRKVVFEDNSSIEEVDYIIFSTGYHWHYPFLSEENIGLKISKAGETAQRNSASMIDGLFLDIFSTKDSSLAFVGVTLTPLKWPSFEISASVIAGVWSNARSLPSKRQQFEISVQRKKETGETLLFHYYPPETTIDYVRKLSPFLPIGRDPSDIIDPNNLLDFVKGSAVAEKLFYKLKNKELAVSDTI